MKFTLIGIEEGQVEQVFQQVVEILHYLQHNTLLSLFLIEASIITGIGVNIGVIRWLLKSAKRLFSINKQNPMALQKQSNTVWVKPPTQAPQYTPYYYHRAPRGSIGDFLDKIRPTKTHITVSLSILFFLAMIGCIDYAGLKDYQGVQQELARDSEQATATALANPYPSYLPGEGTLALTDPLRGNSEGNGWAENANCIFTGGTYQVNVRTIHSITHCAASSSNFGNFVFEAQMRIIKGNCGGLLFRGDSTDKSPAYFFSICQDGTYFLILNVDNTASAATTLTSGSSSAITQGVSQTNLIDIVANGNTIMLYVNRQQIDRVDNSVYSSGQIGFIAQAHKSPTEVIFSNAKVWTL